MKVLINEQVNKEAWNKFVQENPRGNIFQTYEFYEIYTKTKRTEPLLMAIVDKDGNITAGLLAYIQHQKVKPLKFLTSRAIIQGGPIFIDKNAFDMLMKHYDEIVKKKALFTQIRNIYDVSEIKLVLEDCGYTYEPHLNFLINLKQSENELWYKISKSKRKCINRVINDVPVTLVKDLSNVYPLLKETYKQVGLPLIDESHFIAAKEILGKNLRVYQAKFKDKVIGCRLILLYKDYAYDWYAGASTKNLDLYTNDVIVWSILKDIREKYSIFDFGGAGHPDKPYGVREFKRRFGGDLVNYGRYERIYRPKSLKIVKKGYDLYKRYKRK